MLGRSFLLGAVYAGLASVQLAAGVPTTSPSCSRQPIADFEDIKVMNPVSPTTVVGYYRGLNFQGINVGTFSRASSTGVISHSGTQRGVFGLTSQADQGTIQISIPPTSKSFSLTSLYYATVGATQEGVVTLPAPGEITVKAYDPKGNFVGEKTLTYRPMAPLSQMIFAEFEAAKFGNLGKVVFSFKSLVAKALIAGLIDDLTFSICPK
ncbi:MAG: hypothetical protein Q9182_007001 [Xanthomendoza sp. 2 TL-2023]